LDKALKLVLREHFNNVRAARGHITNHPALALLAHPLL